MLVVNLSVQQLLLNGGVQVTNLADVVQVGIHAAENSVKATVHEGVVLELPARDASFFRLLCAFWRESSRAVASAYTEYVCVFESFADSLLGADQPEANAAIMRTLDADGALLTSRVQLILRGGYVEMAPLQPARWSAATPAPSIVNEVRVRNIDAPHRHVAPDGEVTLHSRALPAFVLWGRRGTDHEWRAVCRRRGYGGDDMEVRTFARCNAPRRARCSEALEASFLALDEEVLWAELTYHADDDLTFALARSRVARKSKLQGFLKARQRERAPTTTAGGGGAAGSGEGGDGGLTSAAEGWCEPVRLKQWPSKDAVQALAAWWIAATLCDEHRSMEPEPARRARTRTRTQALSIASTSGTPSLSCTR